MKSIEVSNKGIIIVIVMVLALFYLEKLLANMGRISKYTLIFLFLFFTNLLFGGHIWTEKKSPIDKGV